MSGTDKTVRSLFGRTDNFRAGLYLTPPPPANSVILRHPLPHDPRLTRAPQGATHLRLSPPRFPSEHGAASFPVPGRNRSPARPRP
jgi:hypothetical protein